MSFPRYAAYKPSRVEWIGEIPAHWTMERGRHLYRKLEISPEAGDGVVTAFRDGQVTLRENRRTEGFTFAILESGYQRVRAGDLVIHGMDAFAGAIGVSESTGKCTPEYAVLEPKRVSLRNRYFADALRLMALRGFVLVICPSVRERAPRFRYESFKDVCLPVPPEAEQDRIVSFLDRETAKIDALVAEQERLVELLKEKRQAVISLAVTKGLNPDAPMKDSGIEWLGKIPAHWSAVQLGRVCTKVADGPHFSPPYADEGVMFLSARNIKVDAWSLDDAKFVSEEHCAQFDRRVVPEVGDVLYTKGGTTGIARAVDLPQRFQVWVHVAVLKLRRDTVDPYYLAYALNSRCCYEQSQLLTRGATNNDLGLTRMIKIWFGLPPLAEQITIVKHLEQSIGTTDKLVREAKNAITLLQERRTALISAAVTGQIDVRSIGATRAA